MDQWAAERGLKELKAQNTRQHGWLETGTKDLETAVGEDK